MSLHLDVASLKSLFKLRAILKIIHWSINGPGIKVNLKAYLFIWKKIWAHPDSNTGPLVQQAGTLSTMPQESANYVVRGAAGGSDVSENLPSMSVSPAAKSRYENTLIINLISEMFQPRGPPNYLHGSVQFPWGSKIWVWGARTPPSPPPWLRHCSPLQSPGTDAGL